MRRKGDWVILLVVATAAAGCSQFDHGPARAAIASYESQAALRPLTATPAPTGGPKAPGRSVEMLVSDTFEPLAPAPAPVETPRLAAGPAKAPAEQTDWLALGREIAADAERHNAEGKAYAPWPLRTGPAYPGDFWRSFGRDAKELPETFWDDTKATFSYPTSLVLLTLAGVSGIALADGRGNDQVEEHFDKHRHGLGKFWDSVGETGGGPAFHFAVAGTMYLVSLAREDVVNYEKSKTLLNALAVTGAMTMVLKVTFQTESPNGDLLGWPSGHTSSSFCLATVAYDQYGPWVGIPLYAFATFVGYERMDARNHDFNDVISGAFIGIAVGYAVSRNHQFQILGFDLMPYTDPARGGLGLALSKRW